MKFSIAQKRIVLLALYLVYGEVVILLQKGMSNSGIVTENYMSHVTADAGCI